MTCPDCGTAVYMTRYGPYEVERYVHHYCADHTGPELDTAQIDRCDCGTWYVRINGGEKLDLAARTPHVCQPVAPVVPPSMPDPPRQVSVEPPPVTPTKPWRVIP